MSFPDNVTFDSTDIFGKRFLNGIIYLPCFLNHMFLKGFVSVDGYVDRDMILKKRSEEIYLQSPSDSPRKNEIEMSYRRLLWYYIYYICKENPSNEYVETNLMEPSGSKGKYVASASKFVKALLKWKTHSLTTPNVTGGAVTPIFNTPKMPSATKSAPLPIVTSYESVFAKTSSSRKKSASSVPKLSVSPKSIKSTTTKSSVKSTKSSAKGSVTGSVPILNVTSVFTLEDMIGFIEFLLDEIRNIKLEYFDNLSTRINAIVPASLEQIICRMLMDQTLRLDGMINGGLILDLASSSSDLQRQYKAMLWHYFHAIWPVNNHVPGFIVDEKYYKDSDKSAYHLLSSLNTNKRDERFYNSRGLRTVTLQGLVNLFEALEASLKEHGGKIQVRYLDNIFQAVTVHLQKEMPLDDEEPKIIAESIPPQIKKQGSPNTLMNIHTTAVNSDGNPLYEIPMTSSTTKNSNGKQHLNLQVLVPGSSGGKNKKRSKARKF